MLSLLSSLENNEEDSSSHPIVLWLLGKPISLMTCISDGGLAFTCSQNGAAGEVMPIFTPVFCVHQKQSVVGTKLDEAVIFIDTTAWGTK